MIDISEMSNIDLELNLLSAKPLLSQGTIIKPVSIGQVIDVGYTSYQFFLHVLTIKPEDLSKDFKLGDNAFSLIMEKAENVNVVPLFVNALMFFTQHNKFDVNEEDMSLTFYGNEELDSVTISKDNFEAFVEIIKYQNCVKSMEDREKEQQEEKAKVTNSRVAMMLEKMKKAKEKVEEAKRKQGKGSADITFPSIISAVTAKSNTISKFNFCDLTVYQLYDEYKRLQKISGFDISVLAMVNGAKVELGDWSAKM